jgi:CHAT domain-containing protein/tetratricopeptide (TPR) repeat protein
MRYGRLIILAGLLAGLFELIPKVESSCIAHATPQPMTSRKSDANKLLQNGTQQTQSGQFEVAKQTLQKALQSYQVLKDDHGEANTLIALGRVYQDLSGYEPAIAYYQQALRIFQQANARDSEAEALMNLGHSYEVLARYEQAMRYYEQARSIYQQLTNQHGIAEALLGLGTVYESLAQYENAIRYYEQSLAIARDLKNRRLEGRALGSLGTAYLVFGDYTKAISLHKQSLAIKRETQDRLEEGRVLSDMGVAYLSLGNTDQATALYTQSLQIAWEVRDRRGEAIALRNLGKAYEALGRYDRAIESHRKSLAIAQEIGDQRGEGESLINLGVAYRTRGDSARAMEYHQLSLGITRKIGDRRGEGSALGNLGMNYYAQGNYTQAIKYHEQRLAIAQEIGDRQGEGNAMGNLGNAYRAQGNYAKAIEFHERRLAITRAIKEIRGQGQSLGFLGLVYRSLGNYPKAIEYYKQSLEIAIQLNDRLGKAKSLGYLGNAYHDQGNYQEAIKYHQASLEAAQEISDRRGEGKSLGYLGNAYVAQGRYSEAIRYYQASLEIAQAVNDRRGQAKNLGSLGNAYLAIGDYAKAINLYKSGLEMARQIKNRDGERIALSYIGAMLQKQNQLELSIVFYKQSVNISESIRQEIKKLPRDLQEIYTSSVAGTYRNLADLLLTQGRIQEAQSILELLKVQEVRSYGNEDTDSSPVQLPFHPLETKTLQAFEEQITEKSLTLETLLALSQSLTRNRDRITQESNKILSELGNPQAILKAKPEALLIQNLVVGDKFWVVWTDAQGNRTAIVVPSVTQAQLTATVQKFRQQIGSPFSNLDALKTTSTQLYNWLVPPPLQTELTNNPKQALIFSLDHVTRYVPVAALHDGNQYLAQRYALSNMITTENDMSDRFSPNGELPTVLALGTSKAFSTFAPLPNVPAELNAIVQNGNNQGIYPGKIRLDEAFTADTLRKNIAFFRVLHIATHGSFNPRSITESFLLLGNGNRLPITEIASLNQLHSTHLVVLSACETGLSGSAQDGTEISGISGYFLHRGAKSVLASLWLVNDASTSLLIQQFYKHLAKGTMTKAAALQQAQLELLQGKLTAKDAPQRSDILIAAEPGTKTTQGRSPDFSHPYYWAPFILIGNSL